MVSVSSDVEGCCVGGNVVVVVVWRFMLGLGSGLAVRNCCAPGTTVPFRVSGI